LINSQELVGIQVTWHRDSLFKFSVADIYNEVYGTNLQAHDFDVKDVFEKDTLKEVFVDETDYDLINELLEVQQSRYIMVNNYGLQHDLENHLEHYVRTK